MKKLTAEKCCQLLDTLNSNGMSILEGYYCEALEIALPLLELQDHEKSIIAEQLEAVRDSLALTPHQNAIISCAIDRLNVLTSRTLELSSSLIKQQERGEGDWIEWGGGKQPVPSSTPVEVKFRGGTTNREDSAGGWSWECTPDDPRDWDIIAYRIIPERATNQNGEQ